MERRLAAILAADMVGYSRLMAADEAGTIERQKSHRADLIDPKIAQYGGRIVKTTGDGLLVEFPSVVDAVHCAIEMQGGMPGREAGIPETERIQYRIGINLGDIVIDGADILGDGVNIAARLEGLAEAGGICISESVYNQVRGKLDLIFDHLGEREVKNIPEPVCVYRVVLDGRAAALVTPVVRTGTIRAGRSWLRAASAVIVLVVAIGAAAIWQPWGFESNTKAIARPSNLPAIAVLPFDNISGDSSQEYFSDGITGDLINNLSRVPGLFVISRNTAFTFKGQPVKVQDIGRELGVGYVLEGSVLKAGHRVRINAQLVNTSDGGHIWANRYNRDLTDVFAVQDEVTNDIVSALAVKLTGSEISREGRPETIDPDAYDLLLRGLESLRRYSRETNIEARNFFERAIAIDESYARAHANIAYTHVLDVLNGYSDNPEKSLSLAEKSLDVAARLDDRTPQIYESRSTLYRIRRQYEPALADAEKLLRLSPNSDDGFVAMAMSLNYMGRPSDGLSAALESFRLNPQASVFHFFAKGMSLFHLERYEEAAAELEKLTERNPSFLRGHLLLAATYAHLGRIDDAEWEVTEAASILPEITISQQRQIVPYARQVDIDRYLAGLRKAGVPE